MGKCVRIRGSSKPLSPPGTASCLTLRSGRRVPPVSSSSLACSVRTTTSGRPRRRHRGSANSRWCGAGAPKKSACGSSPRRSGGAAHASGSPEEEEEVPSSRAAAVSGAATAVVARGGVDHGRGDSFNRIPKTPLLSDDYCDAAAEKAKAKHENESHQCNVVDVAGQMPPTEAEIEAFFAAAELAERRRFAEAYNYDVALDRPLEGRFEWAPVST